MNSIGVVWRQSSPDVILQEEEGSPSKRKPRRNIKSYSYNSLKRILSLTTIIGCISISCISILKQSFATNYETNHQQLLTRHMEYDVGVSEGESEKAVTYCKAYKWQETIENKTLDAAYDFFANVVNTFADNGIQLLLNQGSLLGARRHFSFIPWDVQGK